MSFVKWMIVFFGLMALLRCSSNAQRKSSTSSPQKISKSDAIACAQKSGMSIDELFFILDSTTAKKISKGIFPKTFIYDSLGNLMEHLPCFATQMSELKEFSKSSQRTITRDTLVHLIGDKKFYHIAPSWKKIMEQVYGADSGSGKNFPRAGFYVVYYWSTRISDTYKKAGLIQKYVDAHPEIQIKLIKINCDGIAEF